MRGFKPILEPRSLAVIGASADSRKPGYTLLKNILDSGYPGGVYPINPKGGEILGRKAYPTVLDVPGEIDLVFFLLPRERVVKILDQCGEKGVKGAVIVTAGFGEVSGSGRKYDAELREAIRRTGVRCIGPNTIGVANAHRRCIAGFVSISNWLPGKVSIMAQTGNFTGCLANQIMDQEFQRLAIGKSVAVGNKVDLDEVDFLEYCRDDPETEVVGLYLESLPRARSFFSIAQEVKREKPVVVLKSGRTEVGAQVLLSHTGSLKAEERTFDAACRQYGIVRARTVQEFLAILKGFSFQPFPRNRKVALVTYSGGAAAVASDELAAAGFELPEFDQRTRDRLEALMPEWQPVRNPVDLWPAMTGDNLRIQGESIRAAMDDTNTGAVVLILLGVPNAACDGLAAEFRAAMDANPHKPIVCLILGGKTADRWKRELEQEGLAHETRVPVFEDSSLAVQVLQAMAGYAERREKMSPDPQS
ncbi:MAG: acetate--CoA ligase family protein [Nitrospinota bacterium]